MTFIIEYHYPKSDTKCRGDYWHVIVRANNQEEIAMFGDYYHDKGGEKAAAFIQGVQWERGTAFEVTHTQIADVEDYGDA